MAENILHFGAVRLRVTGSASLQMKLTSLDNAHSVDLKPVDISETSGREPTRICNFISQRAKVEVKTTKINEIFRINRIIVYAKEIYSGYPS